MDTFREYFYFRILDEICHLQIDSFILHFRQLIIQSVSIFQETSYFNCLLECAIYKYIQNILLMEQKQSGLSDFQVLTKLGEGAFGQVYKVIRKVDRKQYACKKIRIGAMKLKQKENALNEVRILASYNHQYIIGYKQSFYDETSQTLCVIMQFAAGGDVLKMNQKHLKLHSKYNQDQIWTALVHMTKGLKSLHDKKILHRDLKCANVFITSDKIYKLGDLNVSKVLKKDFACTQTGTPYYASPQVWKDQPYGVKSDMWSLGCVLYEMAALRPPFTAHDLSGLYKKVCAGIFDRIPIQYSNDLQIVISSLLKIDPKKRPDTEELLSNPLVHKYYKGQIEVQANQQSQGDTLLQTIKYNPKDLKGLRNILPKSNYITQEKEENEGPKSCKGIRKQIQAMKDPDFQEKDRKLKQFLEKRKQIQQKERQHQLKILKQHSQELLKKKERVLSACGIRKNYISQSPKIAIHKKDQLPQIQPPTCRPNKKDQISLPNSRLPPKPQGLPIYKLPPKPNNHMANLANKSTEVKQRQGSRENLRNIGARIVNQYKPIVMTPNPRKQVGRCNSARKVIYPSWWG